MMNNVVSLPEQEQSIDQLKFDLARTQIALQHMMEQRNIALNQLVDAKTAAMILQKQLEQAQNVIATYNSKSAENHAATTASN